MTVQLKCMLPTSDTVFSWRVFKRLILMPVFCLYLWSFLFFFLAQRLCNSLLFYFCTCRCMIIVPVCPLLSWSSSSITYASFKCPSVHHFIHLKTLWCVRFCWFLLIVVLTFVFKETACLFSVKWPLNTPRGSVQDYSFFYIYINLGWTPPFYVRVCFSSLWRLLFLCNVADCLF